MARVSIQNLIKYYGSNLVLSNLNLEIRDQEFLVLVGPSGCGKSTLLRIIAGLEDVNHGEVIIGDQNVSKLPPKDRDIAMVFQNYALYPHMSVYENLSFGLKMRKVPPDKITHRVQDAAEILGITQLLDRKPSQLSGGQKQRVALGRAIVRSAKVFLLDEPLSNLDAKLRVQMRAEIIKLHRKLKSTMIYVTHDQTEAMTMGDRIIVMKDGKIHQAGTPEEIYNYPANMFVAGFIGMPPMNFISWKPKIILGIRPEHITLSEQRGGVNGELSDWAISGTVEVLEYTGAENIIYLNTAYGQLVVRSNCSQKVVEGEMYTLYFSPAHVHLFDEATGMRVIDNDGLTANDIKVRARVG